jgi:cardiolipin synthase
MTRSSLLHLEWDQEVLYTSGDEYFAHLLQAIATARSSIELETYIFEKGILAERFIQALIRAVERGVRVRILVDGWGSPGFASDFWPRLKNAGVRVRFFRLNPWILRRMPGDPHSFWTRAYLRLRHINRGNHRKFCLVDRSELWVGSFNISDVHLFEVRGEKAWKDVGVSVRGRELKYARRAFHRAYRGWTALNWPARSPRLLLLNDSFLHKRQARLQQISRMRFARTRVWLATPYFVPVGSVFRLLARQAKRGLDVRLIVPDKSDIWYMNLIRLPLLHALVKRGVRVFIYSPRFAHQKVFVADNWMCIGSTNLNHRSFLHDLEMDVVITHGDNQKTLLESYLADQELSRVFDSREWLRLPWWKKLLSSIFLLGRYWS